VDIPFRGNWLLQVNTPFHRWLDLNRPGMSSTQGLGNLSAVLGWRAYNTPEYAFLIGAASSFPTASEDTLGSGKYTVGPFIATGRFLPQWESFLFGVFQHQVSAGGDPSRADISFTSASVQINTIWPERWWSTVQGGVAGQLGAKGEEQHGSRSRAWSESGRKMGSLYASRGWDLGDRCHRSL